MKSKLGFHIDVQGFHGQKQKIVRAGTRIVKVISNMGLLKELHDALGDRTIFVARDWKVTDDFLRFGAHTNPKAKAKEWMDGMRPAMVQAPFAYWESFNEMAAFDYLREFGEFEAERQRIMATEGFKACIFNFAVGTPEIDGPKDDWPKLYSALERAHELGNIVGLHEYGDLRMDTWYGPNQSHALRGGQRVPFPEEHAEGWLFGRYRKLWRLHLLANGWTNVRVAITEFGIAPGLTPDISAIVGYPTGAWRACAEAWSRLDSRGDTEQYYVEQLQWCDRQMQKDPYMLGAMIFTWGSLGDWGDFEINGPVADKLIAYIEQTQDDAPLTHATAPTTPTTSIPTPNTPAESPTVDTSPTITGTISVYLTPLASNGVQVRGGPSIDKEPIAIVYPGDKLGALEDISVVSARLGKANMWLKVRLEAGSEGFVPAWLIERFGAIVIDIPTTGKLVVTPSTADGVFMRSGPGIQFQRIASLFVGDLLEVLDTPAETEVKIGRQGQWLKVRTARGRSGWVAAWLVKLVGDPSGEAPLRPPFLRTTAEDGLNVRSGPGPQNPPVASAFPWHRLEIVGDPNAAHSRLGKQGEWIQVKTPNDIVGWAAAWFLEEMPPYHIWPGGHAMIGLHGPADPGEWAWDQIAYEIVRRSRVEAIKLMAAGDISGNVTTRLRRDGARFIMARLFAKFETKRPPRDFVHEVADASLRLHDNGVNHFEVHNEPNVHTHESPEGMWIAWQNGAEFADFFLESVALLRQILPGAQFGFPGVSPGPDIPNVRAASDVFLAQAEPAVYGADFVCMHTYWGGDGSTYLDSIGKVRAFCDRYPDKPVFVTEFSNTNPNVDKDVKGREYVQFYSEAKKLPSNLGGLFCYVLSSSTGYEHETWKGSTIADRVGNRSPA